LVETKYINKSVDNLPIQEYPHLKFLRHCLETWKEMPWRFYICLLLCSFLAVILVPTLWIYPRIDCVVMTVLMSAQKIRLMIVDYQVRIELDKLFLEVSYSLLTTHVSCFVLFSYHFRFDESSNSWFVFVRTSFITNTSTPNT
jgi:hypothetical protein